MTTIAPDEDKGEDQGQQQQRFLTPARIQQIGERVGPLIQEDLSWVERRKESVEVLDDTALRRQISVDFSLRSNTQPLLTSEQGDALFCAPVYVLPKAPSNLMSFDLEDENGQALTLINRTDNARISGAALRSMATHILKGNGNDLPDELAAELQRVAEAEAAIGPELARRLLNPTLTGWPDQVAILKKVPRFEWWLRTLAHSSLVVVLFRAVTPRRKLVKLSFEQPIAAKQRWLTRLGWTPYKVGVDTSLVEARSYHFEAQSPPGLRISDARLSDDANAKPVSDSGFLKRVHLYRPDAQAAGAGTGILWLSVSSPGFVGGALSAAVLAVSALFACWYAAPEIAANPTSAPALLLVLPALIASYVARPDQHALTTRLLSGARRLLLAVAFFAYGAAAFVALGGNGERDSAKLVERTESLELGLGIVAFASVVPLIGLSITWFHNRKQTLRRLSFKSQCYDSCFVAAPPRQIFASMVARSDPARLLAEYELVDHDDQARKLVFIRTRWHGAWVLTMRVEESDDNSILTCSSEHVSYLKGMPIAPLLVHRQDEEIKSILKAVQDWAAGP